MNPIEQFEHERTRRIRTMARNVRLKETAQAFTEESTRAGYSYNFIWMGRPIIQYPQDMMALQELVWQVRPDVIVETGIAHGGSLIYSASLLELLGGDGFVVGVDVDIRAHNRAEIEKHPMSRRIRMFEGSSVDEDLVARVRAELEGRTNPLVILDSNHTHAHALRELELYTPFVRKGSYCVVFDTIVEFMPKGYYADRPWDVGDNPWTAVQEFLRGNDRFEVDGDMDAKLSVSMAPGGYLRCVKD
jgi:cephalosporin hydroxylase